MRRTRKKAVTNPEAKATPGEELRVLIRRAAAREATHDELFDALMDVPLVVPSVAPAHDGLVGGFKPLSCELLEGTVWAVYPVADISVGPGEIARFTVTLPGRELLRLVPPGIGLSLDLGAVPDVVLTSEEIERYLERSRVRADQVCAPHGVGVYRGVELRAYPGEEKGTILLLLPPSQEGLVDARDVLAQYPDPSGRWVKVALSTTSRQLRRAWKATWHDEPMDIEGAVDPATGLVRVEYGRDPAFARRWDMSGDQYSGWWASVPFEELVDVRLTVREVPRR